MAPQERSLRRSRGIKKRNLFNLASQDASRMNFGSHLDLLGLDFEQFLEAILAWKLNPKCVCHLSFALHCVLLQVPWIFMLVSTRDIFLAVLGIAYHRVVYFFPHFQFRHAMNHRISHIDRHATLCGAHCSMIPMSRVGRAWIDVEVMASGHWGRCSLCFLPRALL